MMADCLYYGLFGYKDICKAAALYRYCDNAGLPRASHNIGLLCLAEGNYQGALTSFEKASETRADSCLNLALLHDDMKISYERKMLREKGASALYEQPGYAEHYKITVPNYLEKVKLYADQGDANCGRYIEGKNYSAASQNDDQCDFQRGFEDIKSRAYGGDPISMLQYAWEGYAGAEKIWMKERDFIQKSGPKDQGHLLYWLRLSALANNSDACVQYSSLKARHYAKGSIEFASGDLPLFRKAAGYGARAPQQLLGVAMMSGDLGLYLQDEGCFWWILSQKEGAGVFRPHEKNFRVPSCMFMGDDNEKGKYSEACESLISSMSRSRGQDIELRALEWRPDPMDDYIDQTWWSNYDAPVHFEVPLGKISPYNVDLSVLSAPSFYEGAIEYRAWL